MRIGINLLFLIPNQVGGTEYLARSFIDYLQKLDKKNEYVIFCNNENYDTFTISSPKWEKVNCKINATNRTIRIIYEQSILIGLVLTKRCNILHSFGYFGPIFCPIRHVVTVHDANWKDHPENISLVEQIMSKILIEGSMATARKIVVDSDFSRQRLKHFFPNYKSKIEVVKAGVEDKFRFISKRKSQNPLRNKKYILCVGAMYPHKKIPYLLDIFEQIAKIDGRMNLVLIGNHGKDEQIVVERMKKMPKNMAGQT